MKKYGLPGSGPLPFIGTPLQAGIKTKIIDREERIPVRAVCWERNNFREPASLTGDILPLMLFICGMCRSGTYKKTAGNKGNTGSRKKESMK